MLTKLVAQRIDNGWLLIETGKEADGSTYKHTRSLANEKAVIDAIGRSLEMGQRKLDDKEEDA